MKFIELNIDHGKKFILNISSIQSVFPRENDKCSVYLKEYDDGNDNRIFEVTEFKVKESYEEIKKLLIGE